MRATLALAILTVFVIGLCLVTTAIAANDAGPEAPLDAMSAPVADGSPSDAGVAVAAVADQTPNAEEDPVGAATELVKAVRSGNWRLAASLALALAMFGLARVRKHIKWFKGDRGGAVLVGILALGGALVTALASESPVDWKLFLGAAGVMWTAVGGYTWVKKIIWPKAEEA